jgi:hypothetical protein
MASWGVSVGLGLKVYVIEGVIRNEARPSIPLQNASRRADPKSGQAASRGPPQNHPLTLVDHVGKFCHEKCAEFVSALVSTVAIGVLQMGARPVRSGEAHGRAFALEKLNDIGCQMIQRWVGDEISALTRMLNKSIPTQMLE